MLSRAKLARRPFADDQVGRRDRCPRIARDDSLAIIEVAEEGRRPGGVYANDPSADIGEKTPAYGGGQPVANLRDPEPGQYRHFNVIP